MNRTLIAALFLLPLFLFACAGPSTTGADGPAKLPPGPGGPDPAQLTDIKFYNSSLGVGDYLVTITASGDMNVQERRGPAETDVHRSSMHLTSDQIATLQTAFKGWKKLSANYPGDWASLVQITYDGYMVEAHDLQQAPTQYKQVMATLNNLAKLAVASSTQPATSH